MAGGQDQLVHALSFDIEDWFHIVEVEAVEDPDRWPRLSAESSLVERYTDRILGLCAAQGARATFFLLGWIAERHPELCARIASAGHEIGTHSYWHRKVYELTPDEFRADIERSLEAIESATGVRARAFRAPSFSITEGAEWAFDVLLDLGIEYDASLFPATRGHGGYPCARGIHAIRTPAGRELPELPMSVMDLGPKRVCYSGGGYLRVLPARVIERGVRREAASGRATVIYLHPRDFAPDCPRVPMPMARRFKCYTGMRTTEGKLRRLLERFSWGPCREVLARGGWVEPETARVAERA